MAEKLSEEFWTECYEQDQAGWDIGVASTPLVTYIDQLENKDLKILIPGAGNGYEAEYLFQNGFKNVFVLDIAKIPLDNLLARIPDFPSEQLIHQNFFDHDGQYDLILEQTFFCALDPKLRQDYANHIFKLLKKGGKLVGLYFCFKDRPMNQGPPYNGTLQEYLTYFTAFDVKKFGVCYNSIQPRDENELFAIFQKK
jgi:hypothetical protein